MHTWNISRMRAFFCFDTCVQCGTLSCAVYLQSCPDKGTQRRVRHSAHTNAALALPYELNVYVHV
jgi:hypothetical protein